MSRDCGVSCKRKQVQPLPATSLFTYFFLLGCHWKDRIVEIPVQKNVAVPQAPLCNRWLEFNIAKIRFVGCGGFSRISLDFCPLLS